MPMFPDESGMIKFKKNLIDYFILKKNEKIVNLLKKSHLEFRFYTHDNWDGGFDVYDLYIDVSLELYVQIEDQVDEIKESIGLIAGKLISGTDHIGGICIQISESSSLFSIDQELLEVVDKIKILLLAKATGQTIQPSQEKEYKDCRKKLLNNEELSIYTASFIRTCSDLNEFWSFIQPKFKTYKERRDFIRETMEPLFNAILAPIKSPVQIHAMPTLNKLNSNSIRNIWLKSINRLINDPEGAVTAAKTLLEDVIKNILNDLCINYSDDNDDLPKLYGLVAEALQLSPAQHIEKIFKQILGVSFSIILGLAGLRNKISDAHASGKRPVIVDKRHAEWVVNLAGTTATFLVATWEHKKGSIKVERAYTL
jgi:hypothetical protein